MEQTKLLRSRRSRNQIELLLQKFDKGTSPVSEFCAVNNISKIVFYKWQSRYRNKTIKTVKSGFAKLKISNQGEHFDHSLFAEVNGIKLYQAVAASYLKELCS